MAKKSKKKSNQAGLAVGCWILGLLILIIVFFIKKDEIYTNLKTTQFFERLFGTTPDFIKKHEVKEEPVAQGEKDIVINLKPQQEIKKTVVEKKPEPEAAKHTQEKPKAVEETPVKKEETTAKKPEAKETVSTVKTETKAEIKPQKKLEPAVTATRNQNLYFVFIGEDGVVSRKKITRTVEKNDSPLLTSLKLLLAGPNDGEQAKGYMSLIPEGTRLLSLDIRDGVAFLNFSEEFEFNYVGVDGFLGQLMQIVYTSTEFPTVKSVQFLIEGQKKDYLGLEGVWIGSPLSRSSF